MTQAEIDAIANKLEDIGRGDLADQFLKNPDAFDFSVLENDPNFTDQYANVATFKGDKYKILQDLYNQFEGKKVSDTRFETLKEKYPFLDRKELDEWFDKSNQYRKMFEEERKAAAAKKRRELEVQGKYTDVNDPLDTAGRNWGFWRNLLTSDYEKQRYINEPDKALFGKEAPELGEAKDTRWGAIGDLGTGAVAGVADVVPGVGSIVVGPAIRAGRDVGHKVSNSPYQKDWGTILSDAGSDVAFNATTFGLANARKGARVVSSMVSPEARSAFEVAVESKEIGKGIKYLSNLDKLTNVQIYDYIKKMPETTMKRDLMTAIGRDPLSQGIDRNKINDILNAYARETDLSVQEAARTLANEGIQFAPKSGVNSDYFVKAITTPKPTGIKPNIEFNALKAADAINLGGPGQMFFQGAKTASGRGSKPTKVETALERANKERQKQWYIENYARDFDMGFKPKEIKGDPLYEAWKEYTNPGED